MQRSRMRPYGSFFAPPAIKRVFIKYVHLSMAVAIRDAALQGSVPSIARCTGRPKMITRKCWGLRQKSYLCIQI